MNGKYLLDTNIVIALFNEDVSVTDRLDEADEVLIPAIVFGELYYGANKSRHKTENKKRIDELAASSTILGCNLNTAREYGRIKDQLKQKGTPIPENDTWISSLAIQQNLTLVTRDKHFSEIEDLDIEKW